MAIIELLSLGMGAVDLARKFKSSSQNPLQQFVTRYIQIKNNCAEPISVILDYYTCGVDGLWVWCRFESPKNVWSPGQVLSLFHQNHPIHAAKVALTFTTSSGIRSDREEFILVSEPYFAPGRDTAIIGCAQPTNVFTTRTVKIENGTEEPIRVSLKWSEKLSARIDSYCDWKTAEGYRFDSGEAATLQKDQEQVHAARVFIKFVGDVSKRDSALEWRKAKGEMLSNTNKFGSEHIVCAQKYGGTKRSFWTYVCKW